MLLTFRVKNFKSFGDKFQTFSLIAGKQSKHEDHLIKEKNRNILKFAAIYGANASGKSNFIKALDFLKRNIQKENDIKHCTNFANKMLLAKEDSYFEVELLIDNKLFSYGLEVNFKKRKIISEWLIDYTSKKEGRKIFERSKGKIESEIDFEGKSEIENMFKVFMEEYEKNTTDSFFRYIFSKPVFLTSKIGDINNIFKVCFSILRNIHITYPNRNVVDYEMFVINKKEELEKILLEFSTGISKINFNEISQSEFFSKMPPSRMIRNRVEKGIKDYISKNEKYTSHNIKNKIICTFSSKDRLFFINYDDAKESKCIYNEITFNHNDILFDYGLESDGTKRLIQLLSILLDNSKNKTFFIDEIDRSLHPLLTKKFIELFFKLKKEHKQQLVITTHESRLLDFKLIRQDEIWFTEKNESGYTEMFSLEDFGERNDRRLDKAYLDGRYGAIPSFANDFFETTTIEEDKT